MLDDRVSTLLGYASILAWLGAQLPQVFVNWRQGSAAGLALPFLVSWLCGDVTNLLGCVLTHQLPFQTYLATYFVLVDVCLLSQWIYYSRQNPVPSLPPLSADYPHVHAHPAGSHHSYLRAASRSASWSSTGRPRTRKPRLKSGNPEGRKKNYAAGARGEDSMERSWMSESSVQHSPTASRPRTASRQPSFPPSALSTEPPSPSIPSTERGRSLTRPPPRAKAVFGALATISGSPASSSPAPPPHEIHGDPAFRSASHRITRSTSRSRPPPARRTGSMAFLSVAFLVSFGRWTTSGAGENQLSEGRAWGGRSVFSEPLQVGDDRARLGAGWVDVRHPSFFVSPRSHALPVNSMHHRQKRQTFPLTLSIPDKPHPSPSVLRKLVDDPTPPKWEPDDEPETPPPDWERIIGRASAWICTTLYLTSRLPQIWQNYRRRSVEGLSMLLFIFAATGNGLYVLSILSNPLASYPGFLLESTPYLLGSGGTLCFDFTIVFQSFLYSEKRKARQERRRRRSTKHGLDVEEAAALLYAEEDDGDGDETETGDDSTTGQTSRRSSLGGSRSLSSRGRVPLRRSDSTELARGGWETEVTSPYSELGREELADEGSFDFGQARGGSASASRSRTRPTSLLLVAEEEGEGESSLTLRE